MKGTIQAKVHVLSNRKLHSEEGNRLGKKRKNREETVASTSAGNVLSI